MCNTYTFKVESQEAADVINMLENSTFLHAIADRYAVNINLPTFSLFCGWAALFEIKTRKDP